MLETPSEGGGEGAREEGGAQLAAISNAMVRLHKELFGRGPTKARSFWASPDVLVCVLSDTLTPAERRLAEIGEHNRLRDTRAFFQYAAEDRFREEVERLVGRRVASFISGIDIGTDTSAEVFVLEPRA